MSQLDSASESTQTSNVRARGFVVGLAGVIALNLLAPYAHYVLRGILLASNYFPAGVAILYAILVCILNPIVKRINTGWLLTRAELLLVFLMLFVSAAIPSYGLTGYLTGVIAAPYYYASPENDWATLFHPYVRQWIAPQDPQAIRWFYDGLPPGQEIPWSVWIVPLTWWLSFVAALLFVCTALIAIMQRQWQAHERIAFPLAQVPLLMTQGTDDPNRKLPQFMYSKLFWYGFGATFGLLLWNVPGYWVPGWPSIGRSMSNIKLARFIPPITSHITPYLIGVVYFLPKNVSLGLWSFVFFALAQIAVFNRIGFDLGESDPYGSPFGDAVGWQGAGAMFVLVIGGLWSARFHLKQVWRKAWHGDKDIDDSEAVMPYRIAVVGGLLAAAFMIAWLTASGLPIWVSALLVLAAIILYLGVTRVVIEGGLIFLRSPIIPQHAVLYGVGSASLSPLALTAMGFTYAWFCDIIATYMPFAAHAAKLGPEAKIRGRTIGLAILLALVVALATALVFTLYLGYTYGAFNFREWVYQGGSSLPWQMVVRHMKSPTSFSPGRLAFLGIGMSGMWALFAAQRRFAWWPLHPVGLAVSGVLQVHWSALSIFLGWLAQTAVVAVGGMQLYQRAKPFFLGLILGHFAMTGLSLAIDWLWFFGDRPHSLYW